jgi:hypothetical protein
VHAAVGNPDKHWNRAAQIDQRVQFHRRLGAPKGGPWKERQTQVDCRRIERVNHLLQIQSQSPLAIESSRLADEHLGQVCIDPPIAKLVGIGQVRPRNVAADAHRVEMIAAPQACFDVSQTVPEGHLREGHREELIACREPFAGSRHRIARDTSRQLLGVERIHDLGENEATGVHLLLRLTPAPRLRPIQMQDTLIFS